MRRLAGALSRQTSQAAKGRIAVISAELRRLSTPALFDEVRRLAPRVAVFDCDGTLWSGDAGSGFMRWSIETGLVSPEMVVWIEERYRGYLQGEVSELQICGDMVRMYRGLQVEEMRAAARKFLGEHIELHVFPEMRALVSDLHAAGVEIWAVSSTNDWVIEEGVTRFGIPAARVLAASVESSEGIVGELLRAVPTDEGKVEALRRAGITAPDAVFGNSIHDAAMLAMARQAFAVNPTPALIERSRVEGWPIYFPAAVDPAETLS